jgi:hypothetical protein
VVFVGLGYLGWVMWVGVWEGLGWTGVGVGVGVGWGYGDMGMGYGDIWEYVVGDRLVG